MKSDFTPKLFTLLKQGISKETITKDILSGVIVGIVALPLAIVFAIASGVSPEKGLITAIIAGLIISFLGGSRVQIGGPTGAFIIIVFGIVQQYGIEGLTIATFMAGFFIILMGLARLGNYLKFIPYSLIVGFTSGIALIIFSSQVSDFLGLGIKTLPADIIEKWKTIFQNLSKINLYAVAISIITIIIGVYFHKITKKIPGAFVAIILATLAVYFLNIPVETIESRFGEIPNTLPAPSIPSIDYETIKLLVQPAFAIALLGGIESLLSAVVADSMIGGKHRPNAELVAQGAANIASAVFGGIPATGAIARTATNVKNGGRTPIAGIIHALILLAIILIFGKWAKFIPLSCLAGILIVVAYNMSEWRQFVSILKSNRMDVIILITTFVLTVFFDLIIAIEIGVVLSSFMFMKRMSQSIQVQNLTTSASEEDILFEGEKIEVPENVMLYEINGPLFFGAARNFQQTLTNLHLKPKVIIIRMRYVPFIDATGFQSLKEIITIYKERGIKVLLSGIQTALRKEFEKNQFYDTLGKEFVLDHINQAIEMAKELTMK
ncbi:MAG TPA: SulP family inorganic anion transporter [Flavobacteriaceae bacterium]|nr:SulP family inorganic anion transporter [Flavobacteriaceae bacterium]